MEVNRKEKGIVFACRFLVSVLGSEPWRRVGGGTVDWILRF